MKIWEILFRNSKPNTIDVSLSSKGQYHWSIQIGWDPKEVNNKSIIDEISSIDKSLKEKFSNYAKK